jgi:hypothetical protein
MATTQLKRETGIFTTTMSNEQGKHSNVYHLGERTHLNNPRVSPRPRKELNSSSLEIGEGRMKGRTFQPDILVQVQCQQTFNLHPLIRYSPARGQCGAYMCPSQHYVPSEQADTCPVVQPRMRNCLGGYGTVHQPSLLLVRGVLISGI